MPAYELLLNGVSIPFYEVEVEKQEKRALDKCVFEVKRTQAVSLGDDVKFRKAATPYVYLFGGKVVEIDSGYDSRKCVAHSYAKTFEEVRIFPSKVYVNRSPEYIAQDLVTTYTTLSWASAWSSGVVLNYYEAYGTLGENIRKLAQVAGADYWTQVDSSGVARFYFQPATLTNLGVTLNLSGSSSNARRLSYNNGETEIVNAAEVYGKSAAAFRTYRWNTTQAFETEIFLVNPSTNRRMSARGVTLGDGTDYIYNPSVPSIRVLAPIVGTTSNPIDVVLEYSTDSTPVAYAENTSSISTWGRRQKAYIIESAGSVADLQNFADKIVSLYASPRRSYRILVPGIRTDIRDGGYLTVNDPALGVSGTFVVRKVTYRYPKGETEIECGEFIPEIYDFERSVGALVESSGRSFVSTQSKRVEYTFYFSKSAAPYALVTALKDAAAGSVVAANFTNDPAWFSLDLRISGATTYTATNIMQSRVPNTSGQKQIFYGNAFTLPSTLPAPAADSSYTIGLVVYVAFSPSGTRYRLAPPSTGEFTITVSGVKRILRTTLGWVAVCSHNTTTGEQGFYWGQSSSFGVVDGSHVFGWGFEYV